MKEKIKNGQTRIFVNDYAYPSLSRQTVVVKDVWHWNNYVTVQFPNGSNMAVKESELM